MKKLKEQLDSNKLFEAIFHSISDGVIICDEDGAFLMWNCAAEKIVGIGPTDTSPENWAKKYGCYMCEDGPEYDFKDLPLFRAMMGEDVADQEVYLRNKERPEGVWVSVNGRPLRDKEGNHFKGGVIVFRDITERKLQERQLLLLHDAVSQMTEGVIITDNKLEEPGPKMLFVNDALVRLSGYSRAEILGNTPRMFQGPKTDAKALKTLKEKMKVGKHAECEIINYAKDGSEYTVQLSVNPVFDEHGHIINYASVQTNITERIVMEAEITRQKEKHLEVLGLLQRSIKKRMCEMDVEDEDALVESRKFG
tara:strand:+ start:2608 stop:3534 length:927 start_codon:yes stop_codon:yes gene_type:complete